MECDYSTTFPTDEDSIAAVFKHFTAYEIRDYWPRLYGKCPKACGYEGIAYASTAHYVAGDW